MRLIRKEESFVQKKRSLKRRGFQKRRSQINLRGIEAKLFTARDRELLKGITNADYHYKGSAKIMAQIGKAFAEALEGFKK